MAKKIDVAATEELANEGNGFAQLIMGDIYRDGNDALNVSQNLAKSFRWYQKAANQGFMSAQNNLGVMYANGQGVRQDYKIAKEWFGKACDNGSQQGCDSYRKLNEQGR